MVLLRKYQLDIIFLFFSLAAILWSVFTLLKYLKIDPYDYEWFIAGPLLIIYIFLLSKIRSHIQKQEHRTITSKTLLYWISLGVIIFTGYRNPLPASDYWSVEFSFIIFTLFLADSYWDFRKLSWKGLFSKKELR